MSSLSTSLGKVYELLSQRKCRGYIVGGFIRDWLLDRLTNDVDIAVSGNALSIAKDVAKELDGKFVLLDEVNGIARVVITEKEQQNRRPCGVEWHLDFSSFSGDIESDLARRDFTINAMATELNQLDTIVHAAKRSQLKLIDSFSGKKDLENNW
jgi:tRNA nucleotidyltransferase/poly(A) polymerase